MLGRSSLEFLESLELERVAAPFVIRYAVRHRAHGLGRGLSGVRDEGLIDCYEEELLGAHDALLTTGWSPPPDPVRVYVCCSDEINGIPRALLPASMDRALSMRIDGQATMILPSRLDPELEEERAVARAFAAHEAFHAFSSSVRDPHRARSSTWSWFDEACAVDFEHQRAPESARTRSYDRNWVDLPHAPLDLGAHLGGGYSCSAFVHVLRRHFGDGIVASLWRDAARNEGPLDALARVLRDRHGLPFFSPLSSVEDFFGSAYCLGTVHPHELFPKLVRAREPRALTSSFELGSEQPSKGSDPVALPRLSCRLFRFLPGAAEGLRVRVRSATSRSAAVDGARTELVAFLADGRRVHAEEDRSPAGSSVVSSLTLRTAGAPIVTAILVVSNGTPDEGWCQIVHSEAL